LFGKPDNIEITEDFGDHGYTKKNREAMYAFFQKHLMLPGSSAEEEVDFPTSQELQKTSTGQVSASIGGESVFSQNCKDSEKYLKKLQESRNYNSDYLLNVIVSAKKLSGYIDPSFIDKPVFSGRIQKENYVIEKYFVKGNGSYVIPYVLFVPVKPNNNAVVYLHPSGKTAVASEGEQIEWFVNEGFTVLAPDLLGIGEMGPGIFKGDAYIENTSYNMWYTAMQIGRSIVGVQAADVVKLTRVLKQNHGINDIYGVAKKEMSPLLIHAAAFDTNIARIALIEPYSSYSLLVRNRFYKTNFVHSIVPGALTAYDLPDLAATLAPRKLMIAAITDENGKQSDNEDINKDIDAIRKSYQRQNAENHLDILSQSLPEKLDDLFGKWIR
jgi:hypothetical protein